MTSPEFDETEDRSPVDDDVTSPAGEQPAGEAGAAAGEAAADGAAHPSEGEAAPADGEAASADADAAGPADSAEELVDPLSEAMATIASLEDQVARRNADLYNLEQQYNGFVKRSRAEGAARQEAGVAKVLEALLPVLDDVELARQHGDLTGPFASIADKLEAALNVSFGLERFGAVGDAFDPQVHEALMHSTSAEAESESVSVLIQPGYKVGDKVLRPARVGVVSPE